MDPELVAAIEKVGPIAISLGGLVVAGLSLWFTHRERRAVHRSSLYEQQLEAYLDVLRAVNSYYIACLQLDLRELVPNQESQAPSLYLDTFATLTAARLNWQLVLPANFQDAVLQFIALSNATDAPDMATSLNDQYETVIQLAREAIGVDPLSKEILHVIGSSQPRGRS